MSNPDDEINKFLEYWFAGFSGGLDALDASSRQKILDECGRACARSYTVAIFREAWQGSSGLEDFLQRLHDRLPEGHYEHLDGGVLRATYSRCGCDLVRLGWVSSPTLCECSAANLRENLESAMGAPVSVEIQSSILRGAESCVLIARFAGKTEPV